MPSTTNWMNWDTVRSDPQVGALHALVGAHGLGVALERDAPRLEDVRVVGEAQDEVGVLLDDQHGDALLAGDLLEDAEQLAREDRRQAERRLVEQHQPRA